MNDSLTATQVKSGKQSGDAANEAGFTGYRIAFVVSNINRNNEYIVQDV